ncbi:hypothetical protein [Flavobacterium fluviatile]|uniref:hypothetical protein n=1 Tax=Flavobacterium fluviatile TaxID=1862387 RepID=UPI0013D635FD|nr:hypothetical protein [Flavobacterium fluviatile]
MKPLFKKQKQNQISNKYWLMAQDKWAKKMSALASGLSREKLIFLLIGFVIFTGSISICIVWNGFNEGISQKINILPIAMPANVNKEFKTAKTASVSFQEYKRILRFRFYLDSLASSSSGRKMYNSIQIFRPGLLDSLVFIENYYKSNVKD